MSDPPDLPAAFSDAAFPNRMDAHPSASYLIGLDYGTESARAVLMRADGPEILASAVHPYRHGVIERHLRGRPLPRTYALQDADDYLLAARELLTSVGAALPADAELAGIGVAFTSSTPLPVNAQGDPLSRQFAEEPHAYVKLWKHRAAAEYTAPFQAMADLDYYGGSSSPDWLPAKALELASEAPELWAHTSRFVEAADWLTAQLCGEIADEVRSASHAGFKAHHRGGQSPPEVESALAGRLGTGLPQPLGTAAGRLSAEWQAECELPRSGLSSRPIVAVSTIDAHAACLGLGLDQDGELTAILGTSACYLLSSREERALPGICGVVDGGIVPGLYGYEAGQAGFGDVLSWFVRTHPAFLGCSEAQSFEHYNALAAALRPGEHGLLGLDWFNGCRTPLDRGDLSGLLLGYSTATTLADMYRALLDSLCFGARRVIDTFRAAGVQPTRMVLTGGLSERHPLLVQLLCDVVGQPLEVAQTESASARGAAIHAAVACGAAPNFGAACRTLAGRETRTVQPDPAHHAIYNVLYTAYLQLGTLLAASPVMAQVQALASSIRTDQRQDSVPAQAHVAAATTGRP
ncbi:ribulokinase [Deinococcus sp. Arct2-2]|uniref:ribulokinase n=1 Tax=Deinococcus sp. Arct2-2 TaxID=2568653 RepID=UPI0010A39B72|nr:ribulokinase [Deinococcus sp. Arct2-2]THF70209.1 ribulokinase [Deinococcus sp. Arct2-2]